jgi:hypothetical protein
MDVVGFEKFKPVGLEPRLVTLVGDIPAKELVVTGLEAGDGELAAFVGGLRAEFAMMIAARLFGNQYHLTLDVRKRISRENRAGNLSAAVRTLSVSDRVP